MYFSMDRIENFRDLGNMKTKNGKTIKSNVLFRCGDLSNASQKDIEKIMNFGVDMIIDFRSSEEFLSKPDPEIVGVEEILIPINEEKMEGVNRDKDSNDRFFDRMIKASKENPNAFGDYMVMNYRNIINSAYSNNQYKRFIELLADDKHHAYIWHCTAGKDRTGIGTILLLEILGVDRNQIIENYLETNLYLNDSTNELLELVKSRIDDLEVREKTCDSFRLALSAHLSFINAAYETMETKCGSVENYIKECIHIDEKTINKLKEKFLNK